MDNEVERRCYKKDWLTDDTIYDWTKLQFPRHRDLAGWSMLPNRTELNLAKKEHKAAFRVIRASRRARTKRSG